MRRGLKAALVVLTISVVSSVTACDAGVRISAAELADRVAATVEARLDVPVEVDCGSEPVTAVDGATAHCDITDPAIDETYPAIVKVTDVGAGHYDISLSVDAAQQKHDEGNDQ